MKLRTWGVVLTVALLAAGFSAPAADAAKKEPKGPTVVGTDDAGDWGCNQDCALNPIGDSLGQDLVEAAFEMDGKTIVNFIITVNNLPAPGGMPEITRYTWEFVVDGEAFQLSGGYTEYVRGVCNPTTNSCPPPRDPGDSPFFLRQGPCLIDPVGGIECEEVALLHAVFDPETGTITIPVELELVGAKPGSKIGPGTPSSGYGGNIYSAPGLFVTQANLPHDTLAVTEDFVVPKGKKKKKKKR